MFWKHSQDRAAALREAESQTAVERTYLYRGLVQSMNKTNELDEMVQRSLKLMEPKK